MKINSNTIIIDKKSSEYYELEGVIKKIANENSIDNVSHVDLTVTENAGTINFRIAEGLLNENVETSPIEKTYQENAKALPQGKVEPIPQGKVEPIPQEGVKEKLQEEPGITDNGVGTEDDSQVSSLLTKQLGEPQEITEEDMQEAQGWLSDIDNLIPKEEPKEGIV